MRFIFHYFEAHGPTADFFAPGPWSDVAVAVERCGFDGFSISEHIIPGARWLESGGHQTLDPFVSLAFVAAATERIRLLTYLAVAPYRNPFVLAKAAATLDRLSDGRLILGLGAGYQKSEFHALGVDMAERNALFDEVLDVLPLHWSGEQFSYAGRYFDARDVRALPRPAQHRIPIWIGGNSKASRRRVAERVQGWMPLSGDAELSNTTRTPQLGSFAELAAEIAEIRDAAAMAGRAEPIDVVYCYRGAENQLATAEADRHREVVAEAEKAGVTWILSSSATTDPSATSEWLAAYSEVLLR